MAPCCMITNLDNVKHTSPSDFWQGNKITEIRNAMLAGELVSSCSLCYREESTIGKSMRVESWRDHGIDDNTDIVELVQGPRYLARTFPNRLEFHLGNLCNLKCLTCNPRDSSSFLSENRLLKISNEKQSDYEIDKSTVDQVIHTALEQGLEILDLRGGETMLMPVLKQVLSELPPNHSIRTLRLQTNCTVLDDFWKQMLSTFESVEIMLSIDAHGTDNNYIRYPSHWEDIERTVDYFLSCNNMKLYVNCTVSNLNFLLLPKLIDWCRSKNLYFHYSVCTHPRHYSYTNMPPELFQQAQQQLVDYPEVRPFQTQANNQHWDEFCAMVDTRDKHRGNCIFDILPQYKPYWITK